MRLLSLELEKYGAFTGRRLDFRPDALVHIVYGPNEAGKSTALAAVADLLFGFGDRDSSQAYLHRSADLRVSGKIVARDGQTLAFTRRKGRKATILDTGGVALPDDCLTPFLGGLVRDVFSRAFGLNARALRDGAAELLKNHGDADTSLMAAATGLRGLNDLRRALESEADKVFALRKSSDRSFYQALARHEDARKAIRERELRATDWNKLDEDIGARASQLEVIKKRRADVVGQSARLTRLNRLWPLMKRIDEEANTLSELDLGDGLPRGFGGELGRALDGLVNAERAHALCAKATADALEELSKIHVNRELISRANDVEQAYRGLGAYSKALEDRPRIQEEANRIQAALTELSGKLGLGDFERLATHTPASPALADTASLIGERDLLNERRRSVEDALRRERETLSRLELASQARGQLIDPAPLMERLSALGDIAGLVKERDREAAHIAAEDYELEAQAARLIPPIDDLVALEKARLPDPGTISQFRALFDDLTEASVKIQHDIATVAVEIKELEQKEREFNLDGPLPSPERVAAAREARDCDWVALRATLFLETGALSGAALAGAVAGFEKKTAEADALADASASEADRVSSHRATTLMLSDRHARLADFERKCDDINAERASASARWSAAWTTAKLKPIGPSEMGAWAETVRVLLARRAKLADRRFELARLNTNLEQLGPTLNSLETEFGLQPISGLDPARVSARLTERGKALGLAWDEARDLIGRRAEALRRQEEYLADLQQIDARQTDWEQRWRIATRAISLGDSVSPEGAKIALNIWAQAPAKISEYRDRSSRVAGMTRDIGMFEARATELITALAPELASEPPARAIELLHQRLANAREVSARREAMILRANELEMKAKSAVEGLEACRQNIEALAMRAPAGIDLAQLRIRLDARDAARDALDMARTHFASAADGHDEESVRRDLVGFDQDETAANLEALQRENERLDHEDKEAYRAHFDLLARRAALESGMGAEVAQLQRQGAEADLRRLARDWATLKIACLLLDAALERHRALNKDPFLARAGALFSTLTGGGFSGIELHDDERVRARLMARRSNGDLIWASPGKDDNKDDNSVGLSEATADQLFLALRLAYVEDYASRAEPSPFIGDDLLASFDNDRAGYALRALAQLSERAQPILFTHHRHIVDIAIQSLGKSADIIELG